MTLGGIAVAIGELMDDAIVDVENIFRRLKENRTLSNPKHPLLVVYQASTEVRNSIVFGTVIVIIGFIPLFALSGMEGRLFAPLGVAYIVAILSSTAVSLTLTPVLSYWLLPNAPVTSREKDGVLLRSLKWLAGAVIRFSLRFATPMLLAAGCVTALAMTFILTLERDFLPPFNGGRGTAQCCTPARNITAEVQRNRTHCRRTPQGNRRRLRFHSTYRPSGTR